GPPCWRHRDRQRRSKIAHRDFTFAGNRPVGLGVGQRMVASLAVFFIAWWTSSR
ncbi:unnamed protein product, partial [Tenebrio molitor]